MDYLRAKDFILSKLEKELSPSLYYHSVTHTMDVIEACERFGQIENVTGEDIGSQIIKVIRKIAQIEKRIAAIEEETKMLKCAEIYALMEKVKESEKEGMDLLIQMSGYLDVQIDERKKYLDFLKNGGKG